MVVDSKANISGWVEVAEKGDTIYQKKKKKKTFSGENAETVLSKTQREKAERVQARQRRRTGRWGAISSLIAPHSGWGFSLQQWW